MVDVFEEVEEQLRSDRYKALVRRAAPWVLTAGAVALVAALDRKSVDVSVGGVDKTFTYDLTSANTHADMHYVEETLAFFNVGTSTLSFNSRDVGTPYGPVIGAVSVSGVPEPAGWAMMLVGFGGLGASIRASRRQALLAA